MTQSNPEVPEDDVPNGQDVLLSLPRSISAAQNALIAGVQARAELSNRFMVAPLAAESNILQTGKRYYSAMDGYEWWRPNIPVVQPCVDLDFVTLKLKHYCRNIKEAKGPSDSAPCLQRRL